MHCGQPLPAQARFCDGCGYRVADGLRKEAAAQGVASERKLITVMFSDLTGYTAMSERLDPEEVKDIINRIFGETGRIISRYDGVIDKYIGDAVMALFGVPRAHEDDAVRAIRAAREIHDLVKELSPKLEAKVGEPLAMHTGINTGLVVTGELSFDKGKLGITGDTVNLASRLTGLAAAGEILVGEDTFRQAMGHFSFERHKTDAVKGKSEPVRIFKVTGIREKPEKMLRASGRRARLVGRDKELSVLSEALSSLKQGRGGVISIVGDAGTGKSRLVEEIKSDNISANVKWYHGHAFAYSQNMPYFIIIDCLNRAFAISEGEPQDKIRQKIESSIQAIVPDSREVIPYIASLYSIEYAETENISPEFWRAKLYESFVLILSAIAGKSPVVIYLEDLHWADPSSAALLRMINADLNLAVLFLFVYRPFSQLSEIASSAAGKKFGRQIVLHDLTSSGIREMVDSLLDTKTPPDELISFIHEKVEGNPFYLEEVINTLIESGILTPSGDSWMLAGPISETDIPSSIHGIISARLDRLEVSAKRVLQEASVIGREFVYKILKTISKVRDEMDQSLTLLEELDLIREKEPAAEQEYLFKHALTQEVAYNGLLKKERRIIHERIATAMEKLLSDRIPEFYEMLAYHYKHGQVLLKAYEYLSKSGSKCRRMYSIEESNQYYREAYELLAGKQFRTKEEDGLLISLLVKWVYVFNHRGDFNNCREILKSHEAAADVLDNQEIRGMFYAWMGWITKQREALQEGYDYLMKALRIGEEGDIDTVTAYACGFLSYVCADLGLLNDAVMYGRRARVLAERLSADRDLFAIALTGLGHAYWFKGLRKETEETAMILHDYGVKHSCLRCQAHAILLTGIGQSISGDFTAAIESYKKFIDFSPDPMLVYTGKFLLGTAYLADNRTGEAIPVLEDVIEYNEIYGMDYIGTISQAFRGAARIATGRVNEGVQLCKTAGNSLLAIGSNYRYANVTLMLGNVYLALSRRKGDAGISFLVRNAGFILKNIFSAAGNAEKYFQETIDVSSRIGATGILGQAYLGMGQLQEELGKRGNAVSYYRMALAAFESCGANEFMEKTRRLMS